MRISDFLLIFAIYITADLIYLGIVQRSFVTSFFSKINNGNLNLRLVPAILSWALLAWGLYYFVLSKPGWTLKDAALLGLLVYGVYDLTNLATLTSWTWNFALADIAWGVIVMAIVALLFRLTNANARGSKLW